MLAYLLAALILIYIAIELGWGGHWYNFDDYQRPVDPVRPPYKPKPPTDDREVDAPKPKPRIPELVD